jgi:N-acylglucosamine 2-epimerase
MDFLALSEQHKHELLKNVIPFWERYSVDNEHSGYFTCLDREGKVFDTDKFIWLQAHHVWMFSKLYNKVEPNENWLNTALGGAEFLRKFGHDENLNW